MHIGINGLFLRKPGTGIGQVTRGFLETLSKNDFGNTYTVFVDDPASLKIFSPVHHIAYRYVRPWWKRDDLIRKMLWEYVQLPWAVESAFIKHFFSLYQTPSIFTTRVEHTMLVHDLIPEIFPEYQGNGRQKLLWSLTKKAILAATKVVTVSQATKKDIVEHLGRDASSIVVAYPSISDIFFSATVPESTIKLEPGYLYVGGGLEKRKNIESLLCAYHELFMEDPAIPSLVISGFIHNKNNALATDVLWWVEQLHLEDKVRLLGFVAEEELPWLYKNALLFTYPSAYEGFGLPVLEALAVGTPVMARRKSALPEVAGDTIFWVEEFTKKSLQQCIEEAKKDTEASKEARRERAKTFTWKHFTSSVISQVTSEVHI